MIERMIDDEEKVIWSGKPDLLAYVIGKPYIYLIAIVWGLLDFFFFRLWLTGGELGLLDSNSMPVFGGFAIIHLFPVWIAIAGPIYRLINYHTIEYAITDKRSYISSGIFGRDITAIEHRFVDKLTVTVSFIENITGTGTLHLTPDKSSDYGEQSGANSGYKFLSIKNPYDIYKMLKKISLDVTTDQQFPNAYRPEENPGYNTTLKG